MSANGLAPVRTVIVSGSGSRPSRTLALTQHIARAVGELLRRFIDAGLHHVLSTDVAHDGMAAGPNLALYHRLVAQWPSFDWIASGGVRDRADVDALRETGVAACVAGTALLDGSLSLEALACSHAA